MEPGKKASIKKKNPKNGSPYEVRKDRVNKSCEKVIEGKDSNGGPGEKMTLGKKQTEKPGRSLVQ